MEILNIKTLNHWKCIKHYKMRYNANSNTKVHARMITGLAFARHYQKLFKDSSFVPSIEKLKGNQSAYCSLTLTPYVLDNLLQPRDIMQKG